MIDKRTEQLLLALPGRVTDIDEQQRKVAKYIATLEKVAKDYTNTLVGVAINSNTETLEGTKVLGDRDGVIQYLDPGGASRTITLPVNTSGNHLYIIVNTADAAEELNVEDADTNSIVDIGQNMQASLVSDGGSWKSVGASTGGDVNIGGILFVDVATKQVTIDGITHDYPLQVTSDNTVLTALRMINTTSSAWIYGVTGSAHSQGAGHFYIYDETNSRWGMSIKNVAYSKTGLNGLKPNDIDANLHIKGVGGVPSLSSDANILYKIEATISTEMCFGAYTTSPHGQWIQVKQNTNSGNAYPLCLQPLGGKVGIGTASPGKELQVVGDAKFGEDTANYAEMKRDGEINLHGTARVYKSTTINFSHSIVSAHGKPTAVVLGANSGFSLPVYSADNEELFACKSLPLELDTTVDIIAYVGCYLDTANNAKKFKLQVSWTIDDLAGNDVLSSGVTDVEVETTTGNVAQYTSYKIAFTIASVAASAVGGNKIAIRARRIAASADEIAGEVVVCGLALKYVADKLGTAT